jgi:hypothetical protein
LARSNRSAHVADEQFSANANRCSCYDGPAPESLNILHAQHHRAADEEIQKWVARQHGFIPQSFWIAHCKELFGLTVVAPAARHDWQECPIDKQAAIKDAFLYFGMLAPASS